MPRPVGKARGLMLDAVQTVLLKSGRPVAVAPPVPPACISKNPLVSWNGTAEAARAFALSMPLITCADRVTLLVINDESSESLGEEVVANSLRYPPSGPC